MGGRVIFTVIMAVMLVSITYGSAQVTSPTPTTPVVAPPPSSATNASQEFVDAHNQARKDVGVGPLKWSETLAKSASLTVRYQRDNRNCSFADLSNSQYGGNQLRASGVAVPPRTAVGIWVSEKQYYDYGNNTCTQGRSSCGVYTQVVWKNSVELGCGQAQCVKERSSLTVCFYNPPGNVVGEKPY
ncbi:OLC1v1010005C1 [Oldenlandia corymbosa var. corymbosa]|uniref:OLC1v1010005C1 n=1 Tax=Oldenlandia corymbosa var. corymbosa TaxID=529605 RepID=A0AAV1DTG1_OLDCO|nr:OLC1v1010005C1 [Oldenlandia corymbosa var. corymbosa]